MFKNPRACYAAVACFLTASAADAQIKLRFSGFGDFVAGYTGGGYADPEAPERCSSRSATDPDPVNTKRGFGSPAPTSW